MTSFYPISTSDRLLLRLSHAIREGQKVTFLIGSGLTGPGASSAEPGVPTAPQMVERARKLFSEAEGIKAYDEVIKAAEEGRKYQAAMQFVIECRGQSALNALVRQAVLEARISPPNAGDTDEEIVGNLKGWFLRPAVRALGQLVRDHEKVFQKPILTSNFDPLIEIGIRSAGRGALTINLPNDGSFRNLIVSDNVAQVVHFHGFWSQGDTLHTPDQLTRERPLLGGSLRRLLQETLLVVIGYGGWQDVFTQTLIKSIAEQSEAIDVLWTFYSRDPSEIIRRHGPLLESFKGFSGQRVVAYAGVDCHDFLPMLQKSVANNASSNRSLVPVVSSLLPPEVVEINQIAPMSNPPVVDAWVGRAKELNALFRTSCSVIALHGMGGFGKSGLAARYLAECVEKKVFALACWADCKEQGNTLQTHLVSMLEQISQGEVKASSLQQVSTQDIIELFFQRLGNHRGLFIFDNIDHYVDLETQNAIGTMHLLLQRALSTDHRSQFLFTSRPKLLYPSERFVAMQVIGMNEVEIDELFQRRGAEWNPVKKSQDIASVLRVTQGSALQLNLIATQVAKQRATLNDLLERIEKGTAPEAEDRVLIEIWATLKEEQKEVLRYLAEIPHPESEQRIASCLSDILNYNRFSKAIRTLKSLNLVVIKPTGTSDESIELHPLVRSFIRRRFPKEEQIHIVEKIISFLDRMIGRFRSSTDAGPTILLQNWTAKVELCIENGKYTQAMETLYDVYNRLLLRGCAEEFLRLAELVIKNYQIADDPNEVSRFDALCYAFITTLDELGRFNEADRWIETLARSVAGKSARYIWLCKVRSHSRWLRKDYTQAKAFAQEGVNLKSESQMDTQYDCSHSLALAQRDSGEIQPALNFLVAGEKLESILSPQHLDRNRGGAFYGNIGRCLQFVDRFDDALICLKKSALLLEEERASNTVMNRGWAAQWIGEILDKKGELDLAYVAFRSAAAKWKMASPQRAQEASDSANTIGDKLSDKTLLTAGDWECEDMYNTWLKRGHL